LNTITAIHQGHAWDSELRLDEQEFARKPEAVARSIQIVDLEDCVVDTAALSSSLMTSILQKQPRSRYRFITLVNYPPRRVPATKLQLLVSLAHQYLTHYPRVFRRVQPVFKNVQESMKTSNTLWKEICLERLIKTLLRYHGTDLPFIIIVRPDDEKSDGPVHEVTSNLLSWVSQSEIYAKILVVRYHRPQPGNLGIGTASDIRTEGFRQRNALRKDHESEMKEMLESNRRLSILRPDLTRMLEGIRIMTPSQWIPIFENLLFASTSLANIVSHASKNDQDITDLMLDTVAESTNPWIKSCLGWITHAVRPLSYAEFQAILIYETGTSNHGDFSSVIVEELRKLLPGLVETDGDVIYLARSEIVALLTARLLRQRERRDSTAGVSGTQFDDWNHTTCHPDLYIARYCIRVLRDSFNNEASESKAYADVPDSLETVDDSETDISASEEEMKEKVPPPMLSYAAEHWLTHVQLWIDGSETPSEHSHEEDELKFITEFLHDSKIVNWWLRYRRVHKGKDAECGGEYDMVQAADILSLNPRTRQGALKLATTVQLASDNRSTKETGDTEEPLASIFITSAQLGDSGILAKMDGGMLEEILPKIFQTGADTALCSLAEEKKEFVRRNWWTAMNQAIRMGNLGLFYKEGGCANSNFEPSIWYEIAEHGTYLPEDALKSLKSVSLEVRMEILRLAATSGHSALVQKLIEAGLQPNQGSSPIDIPLFMAAQHGHYQIVGQLLAAIEGVDASVGRMEASHLTPLHTASASGYRDIVGLLLAHSGAAIDLSSQDRGGNTALHLALANGHEEVAVSLLMARQEPPTYTTVTDAGSVTSVSALDSQNLQLHTPLMSAVQSGYLSVVKILLDRKVNVNLADEKGKTALHYAAALEMHEILSLLLGVSGVDLEARDSNNTTPLHEASSQGRPENVKMLLKYKADHTAVDDKDRSPLELASEAGHTVTAKILLPLYGRRRITASFLRAVSTGNVKMAELLMDAGADINAVMPQTQLTALHQGAARSDARLVQSLLLRKAELNPTDQHGRTPLYEAASRGAVDCLKLLVDAGADINVPDSSGVTAMFAAATENYERCVDILLAAPIQRSTQEKNVYRLDAILRTSASVLRKVLTRISGDHGEWDVSNFALQQLLESGTNVMEVLSTLLDYGLKHEEIIGNYGTMLHYAVYQDQPDIVSLLAKDGRARPGVLYAEHGTPLQIAAHYAKPNALAIVKILLHEGAEATLGSDEIGSPLHAATAMAERSWYDNSADARYLEIAQAIIDHEPSTVNKVAGAYPTVLQSAVRLGTVEMVQLILENHPDMSIVEGKWGTPLHLAVHFGFWRELELILSCNDCDLNQGTRDKEGRLPLHMLPRNSYWGMSDYDMLKGDEEENRIREVDNQQRHMVHFCAGLENDRLLELVLIHQPEALEKVDIDGWTPLHWACRHRSYDTIRLLLDRQANKNAVTYRGWRPIDVAKYHGLGDSEELNQLLRPDSGASNTEAPIRCLEGISYDDEEAVPVTAAPRHYGYTCDSCGCVSIFPLPDPSFGELYR
jgi:ankyrin repeat protein